MIATIAATRRRYPQNVAADGAVAYWRLNGNTLDETGSYNGTAVGSPSYVDGIVAGNSAVAFNGSSQYVSQSTLSAFAFIQNTAIFSVEFWVKITDTTVRKGLIGNTVTNTQKGFYVIFENGAGAGTKAIRCSILNGLGGSGQSTDEFRTQDNSITDSNWHHVIITHSAAANNSAQIYIDGIAQTLTYATKSNTTTTGNSTSALFVGSVNNSGTPFLPLSGSIDEVAMYSTALSAARVLAHYQAARPPA